MKISRSSWHYKLYRYIRNIPMGRGYLNPFADVWRSDYDVPSSLCPYCWTIFLGLIAAAGIALAAVVASPLLALVWIGAQAVGVLNRLDAKVWAFKHRSKPEAEKPKRPTRERQPSLLLAFMKARKNKVCPLIELVD